MPHGDGNFDYTAWASMETLMEGGTGTAIHLIEATGDHARPPGKWDHQHPGDRRIRAGISL